MPDALPIATRRDNGLEIVTVFFFLLPEISAEPTFLVYTQISMSVGGDPSPLMRAGDVIYPVQRVRV